MMADLSKKCLFSLGARSQASAMLIARACYVKLLNGCNIDEAMDVSTLWCIAGCADIVW